MFRTYQGRFDEVLIVDVAPFKTNVSEYGTTMGREITVLKLETHDLRIYEETIYYCSKKSETNKVIRVIQNKTDGDGSIGFDFMEIKE